VAFFIFLFQILTVLAQIKLVAVEPYMVYVPPVVTAKYLVLFAYVFISVFLNSV
jgi:hypothetical protein